MRIYCARGALLASASMMAIMSSVAGRSSGRTALGGSADFTLSSPDIADGKSSRRGALFNAFGCTGSNVSPALTWP